MLLSVQQNTPGNLSAEDWALMVDLVKLIKSSAPAGAKALPSELAPVIEHSIRSYLAKPVEST